MYDSVIVLWFVNIDSLRKQSKQVKRKKKSK